MRWATSLLAAAAVSVALLSACGDGRTYGQALEEMCAHFPPTKRENRCFNELRAKGPRFLQHIEYDEANAAGAARLRDFYP